MGVAASPLAANVNSFTILQWQNTVQSLLSSSIPLLPDVDWGLISLRPDKNNVWDLTAKVFWCLSAVVSLRLGLWVLTSILSCTFYRAFQSARMQSPRFLLAWSSSGHSTLSLAEGSKFLDRTGSLSQLAGKVSWSSALMGEHWRAFFWPFYSHLQRSFETQLSRVEAELLRREAPPSYGQLIAQGLIPPVEDFPVCSPNQV